ncbi:ABC transporter substrate-binding protein [Streptomyces sp. st170]|uniref:ABC transporter substrate-binding protein n=1 Tax=Streptomyces sp. st170 TaxID=1828058 RepID=UPI0035A15A7D
MASYTAEKSITLKPNTAYKGAVTNRGVAVEVHYFETSRHVEEAWNARTVDIAYGGLPAATLAGIDPSDEDVRLSAGDSAEAHYLVLNMRSPDKALGRAETRRALASLIDRGRLAGEVFEHTVTPLYSLVPQGVVDRYPEADAAYAAGRLRSAGITTPVRIKLGHQNGIAWWGPAMSSATATHRPRSTTPSGTPSGSPIAAKPCSGSGRSGTRSRRTLP